MLSPYHREVDIGGIELHVDLLVDKCLTVGVEVLLNFRHGHLGVVRVALLVGKI